MKIPDDEFGVENAHYIRYNKDFFQSIWCNSDAGCDDNDFLYETPVGSGAIENNVGNGYSIGHLRNYRSAQIRQERLTRK